MGGAAMADGMLDSYTPDGDLKPTKPLSKLGVAGRTSQIIMASGSAGDHFLTSNMMREHKAKTTKIVVERFAPPNKNRASEPGVPWDPADHPSRETFTTSNELRTKTIARSGPIPMRQNMGKSLANKPFSIGYKEAESANPFMTTNHNHLQDPQLGRRKAGATAKPPPVFPRPRPQINPITGDERTHAPAPPFERYNPDMSKARATHDMPYKHGWNKACQQTRYQPSQDTQYNVLMGSTIRRAQNPGNSNLEKSTMGWRAWPKPQ